MKRPAVLAAALLVTGMNVWTWVAASGNRGDAFGGTLELTERELRFPRAVGESTALLLELEWTSPHDPWEQRGMASWLDASKLTELGFDLELNHCATHSPDCVPSQLARPVIVVLEVAEEPPLPARAEETRLVAIDAGLDATHLRELYPDCERHALVRGVVATFLQRRSGPDDVLLETPRVRGRLEELRPWHVFVPRPHNQVLEALSDRQTTYEDLARHGPRFTGSVSWGRELEPWVESMRLVDPEE